ncbi:hypothetical protein [Psychromonas sp. GE-S-Ul-11]|uniref:hypothetical protein n=1 Tax=Psychromonas sp. GE-S-Ul-11 TaxID=3241170 RepID=UPI00390C8D18
MHYFISLLFTLVIFSVGAEEKDSAVPHNNGTQGLLKNTFIEPIDNFNSIGSELNKTKSSEKTPTPKQQTGDQTQPTPSTNNSEGTIPSLPAV